MPKIRHSIEIEAEPDALYPLVATASGFEQRWVQDVWPDHGDVNLGGT
jgi:hypothetical protein